MSAAEDLLHDLVEHGVTVWQEAGQLRYRAPAGAMTPTMLTDIRQHKPELLALLAANDGPKVTKAQVTSLVTTETVAAERAGPLVLTFELDDGLATCIDPVSASLADAVADIRQQFPGRVGRFWQKDVEVAA